MKRFLTFLAVLLVASLSVLAVNASSTPTIYVVGAEGGPGEEVTVTIAVSGNPGVMALAVDVTYDTDILKLVKVVTVAESNGLVQEPEDYDKITSPYRVSWEYNNLDNTTYEGAFVKLTFLIADDAPLGETKVCISLRADETYDINEENVAFETTDSIVTVKEANSSIKCAQVALGTDISVNYYADVIAADKGAQMRFTMNGKETLVDGTFDEEYGLYVFPFTGITPQCMGDTIKAELVKDGKTLAVKDDYSVLQNCKNLLGKTAKDLGLTDDQYAAMETLIADLMEYGATAQTYRGYKTGSLMNKDETIAALKPTEYVPLENTDDLPVSAALDPEDGGDNAFIGAGVLFDYHNCLYVRFKIADGVTNPTITVSSDFYDGGTYSADDFIECDDGSYIFVLDPMTANLMSFDAEAGCYVEYEITLKGKTSGRQKTFQTLYYSLAAYVFSKQEENSSMANLAKALYNYGLSAADYMVAIEK